MVTNHAKDQPHLRPSSAPLAARVSNYVLRTVQRRLLGHQVEQTLKKLRGIKSSLRPGQKFICIGLVQHFGDIVAAEPVARHLRRENPDAYLVWLVGAPYRELVSSHPALNEVLTISCVAEHSQLAAIAPVDQFVDLHLDLCLCPKLHVLHRKRQGDSSINVFNYFRHGSLLEAFSKSAGLPPLTDAPMLSVPSAVQRMMDQIAQREPFFVIHTTSNERSRDWDPGHWVKLAQILSATFQVRIVEVGLRSSLGPSAAGVINLCGKLSLLQTADLIRRCSGFLGVESGPAHVANAFQRPSVILLGSYRAFRRYNPYTGFLSTHAEAMLIQWDGPVASIPLEIVVARANHVFATDRLIKAPS